MPKWSACQTHNPAVLSSSNAGFVFKSSVMFVANWFVSGQLGF